MVLRPVELDAAGDPRPGEADEGRLDHGVAVEEIPAGGLVDDRKAADVVLVMDALHPSHAGATLPGKQNDNIIFWLTVAGKNFYIAYANVPEGRSDSEQASNLVQETVKLLQEIKAVPWSANK